MASPGVGVGAVGVWPVGIEVIESDTPPTVTYGEFTLDAAAEIEATGDYILVVVYGEATLESEAELEFFPRKPIASGKGQVCLNDTPANVTDFDEPSVAEYDEQGSHSLIDEIGPDADVDAGREADC